MAKSRKIVFEVKVPTSGVEQDELDRFARDISEEIRSHLRSSGLGDASVKEIGRE